MADFANWSSGASYNATHPLVWTTAGTSTAPVIVQPGGQFNVYQSPPPKPPPTALDWLKKQVERTCALAR